MLIYTYLHNFIHFVYNFHIMYYNIGIKLNRVLIMNDKVKNDTQKELVFTLVTCAPSGTLGDVSSCKKYIEETLASHSADPLTKTRFNLVITDVGDRATKDRIKALLGENLPYNVIYERGRKASFFKQPVFEESDAFIFYPSFQITPDVHIRALKGLNKPVLIVNHYNFEASTDKRYASKKEQWMPSLYTGFGPESLGVNIKDLGNKPSDFIIPQDDTSVYDLVFGTGSTTMLTEKIAQKYSERSSLFFGYMNKLGYVESRRNLANPTEFAKACIAKSQKQYPGKEVDVLVRLNDKVTGSSDFNYYDQLEEHFKKNNVGLTVSIYKKDDNGTLILRKTFGDGATKVRIIDPFPVSNNTMINVMQRSDPFSMMTGSESFIESLSCNKLPLYQIMSWHDRLYNELLKEIASIEGLGNNSLLYKYFALQDKSKGTTYEQLVDFLCKHEPKLLDQLQVFKQHLLENKQLRSRLHNRLSELVGNNEEYIHQCLDVQHIVDFNDEPELTTKIKDLPKSIVQLYKMFPDNREIICKDAAHLLTAIVNHNEPGIRNILDFVKGYRHYKIDTQEYNLFPDILSRVADQKVKDLIISAEFQNFSSQLVSVDKWINEKYSPDSKEYRMAMSQLEIINNAKKTLINSLLVANNPEDRSAALTTFHKNIKTPVNVLDGLLEKRFLVKVVESLFKAVCAVLGIALIVVMATSKQGREELNKFFSYQTGPQRDLRKAVQRGEKDEPTPDEGSVTKPIPR